MQQHMTDRAAAARRHAGGFTLTELMIVVAIVGILAAIAYPSYQNNVRESRRSDAHAALTTLAANEERYYSDNNTYTKTLTTLGYSSPATSPEGYYTLTAGDCSGINDVKKCVVMTATATGSQADDTTCATITLDTTGAKGSSPGATNTCWNKK